MRSTPSHDSAILGSLFLRRGRVINRILTIASGAVVALALCGLFGLVHFVDHVGSVADARELGQGGGCIQGSYRYDSRNLSQYENVLLSATCNDPETPPGLTHFPRPGQVYVSPALSQLRTSDKRIAERYPHIDGLIDQDGLTGSNELRAIIGVSARPADTVGITTFDSFGTAGSDYLSTYLRLSRGTLLILGLFFTLPAAGILIAACTRLNARVRERQLQVLAIMGVRETTLRQALMTESAVLTGIGAVAGLIVAVPVYATITPHFVAWTAFPGDMAPSWLIYPVVVLLILATSSAAAWWASRFRRTGHSETPTGAAAARTGWRWGVLLLGLALAGYATWTIAPFALVLAGRFVTVAGLLLVAAPLCARTGQRLRNSEDPLVATAGARLRRPSGALTRALAALISGLFVLSVGASTIQARSDDPAAIQAAQTVDGYSVVEVRRPDAALRATLSDYPLLSGRASTDGNYVGTLSGPCAVIRLAAGDRGLPCSTTTMFATTYDGQGVPDGVTATSTALAGPRADLMSGYVLKPAETSRISDHDNLILIPLPTAQAESLYDRVLGANALNNIRIDGTATVSGASELAGILDVFRLGAFFTVVLSLFCILISLVSLLNDRQPGNNYLQILGLTPRQTATVALIEVSAATTACIALALFSSWLWALTTHATDHPISLLSLTAPFFVAALVLLAAAALVVWNTLRSAGVSVVPDRDNLISAHDTFTSSATP